MMRWPALFAVLSAGCAPAAPLAPGAGDDRPITLTKPWPTNAPLLPPPSVGSLASAGLAQHNHARAGVGAAPLVWDAALADGAAGYAARLAASGRFEHSPRSERVGLGENLWTGTRGAFRLDEMIGGWIGERRDFRPGVFPDVSRTGRWSDVGHYTQIVWKGTRRVGCAVRSNASADYLVCRYAPAGNVVGQRVP